MKILLLTSRIPHPLHDGGNMAVYSIMRSIIASGASLSLLSMNTTRHWVEASELPPFYQQLAHFETVKVDNSIKPGAALRNIFGNESYNIARFVSTDFEQALVAILQAEDYDVIQLEGLYVMPYLDLIRKHSKAKVLYRQHNVEFKIWERLAKNERFFAKKWYLKLLAKRLKRFEVGVLNSPDLVLPISSEDAVQNTELGLEKLQEVIPYGIANISLEPSKLHQPIRFYHIGAMDWQPNQDAVQWLLEEIWPLVLKQSADAELHIAGRNMQHFANLPAGVTIHGEVPAAWEAKMDVLLVPLRSASGLRIKTLSAMAQGKAVISTSIGAAGIACTDSEDILLCDTAEAFAAQILSIIDNPNQATSLAAAGLELVNSVYSEVHISEQLKRIYTA